MPPRPGAAAMNRMMAIVEREMRKFFRSPVLMIMSMMLPLVQLDHSGNAFGGKIVNARVAVVDYDHGPQARQGPRSLRLRSPPTSRPSPPSTTTTRTRPAKMCAPARSTRAVIIPAQYSRRVYAKDAPEIGLVVDNSDQFTARQHRVRDAVARRCAQCARHPAAPRPTPSPSTSSSSIPTSST